jgi:ankyrin repeat protein
MGKLDGNVKKLFADLKEMATESTKPGRKNKLGAEVYRLIELVDVNSVNTAGETLLCKAAGVDDAELVRHLVQKGANIEAKAKENSLTPLLAACQRGNVEIMKIFIDAGADLSASCVLWNRSRNALYFAIKSRSVEAVMLLLGNGLKTLDDESYGTPLHEAVAVEATHRSAPMLSLLLEHGVRDVSALDHQGRTALQRVAYSLSNNVTDITASLAALLDHGAAIDQLTYDGQSALHYAAKKGNTPAVLYLLGRGAAIDQLTHDGQSALHYAAKKGNTPAVLYLLGRGAAIDQPSHDGQSALHYAIEDSHKSTALCLLGRGANVALADSRGRPALHKACSEDIAKVLLDHGALVDAVDRLGRTPLHSCATRDDGSIFTFLLQAGANVNATDKDGDAPLHTWARVFQSHTRFAQLLIDHGADAAARNKANQRPSDVARSGSMRLPFLLAAEEAQLNNHCYKRPRLEDLQPPAAIAAEEEEDESEDDSDDEDEDD